MDNISIKAYVYREYTKTVQYKHHIGIYKDEYTGENTKNIRI